MHFCLWPGCPSEVADHFWGCRQHWFSLPAKIRNEISRTYQPGQCWEGDVEPSTGWLEAAAAAHDWIIQTHALTDRNVADALRRNIEANKQPQQEQLRFF